MLGLHCCVGVYLAAVSGSYSLVSVSRLLMAVASLAAEHGLQGLWASVAAAYGLSSWGSQALEHRVSRCGAPA